jgi:putative hemolysin
VDKISLPLYYFLIGLMFPEAIAMLVARPMTLISKITKPFIWLLTKTMIVSKYFWIKEQKRRNCK